MAAIRQCEVLIRRRDEMTKKSSSGLEEAELFNETMNIHEWVDLYF